jgi:hypothetical protein
MPDIAAAVTRHKAIRDELLATFPDLAWDQDTLRDTLEGQSDLDGVIAALIEEALYREALIDGINERISALTERKVRLLDGAEKLRAMALHAMTEAGLPSIKKATFTASLGQSRASVVIVDENLIPSRFTQTIRKPDKKAIGEALKAGTEIPGCEMSNQKPILTVRTS